ncbi:MAG: ABC-F family ATP-binding cassette domain-containing protein [Bacilli bacterium]|nr:ABC-F family ATP-binding cassette domain-containing protein [Bacilli bacterium]
MILDAKGLSASYGEKILFQNIDISIEDNDKIGLIGINGTGKSTLLSILAGNRDIEKGDITIVGKKKIVMMPQEVTYDNDETVLEYLEKQNLPLFEAKSILTKLEINDFSQKINNLSGGNKRKLALGMALVKESDLLILDEPTNHLDSEVIEWLEKFLQKRTKAILLVTHDRYFLERVCNKIVELDHGSLYSYDANYSKYLELKNQRLEEEASQERKINSFLRKEYEWIKRGALARTTKDKRRIENYDALVNRKKTTTETLQIESTFSRLGKKTIILDSIGYSYDEGKMLFSNLSHIFSRDERLGIVGKNGTGKTTLLDIISGLKEPSLGTIERGETIRIGYFRQENIELDYNIRLIDYISDIASFVKTKNGTISASSMLERFLFPDPYIYIKKLSGGERRRLYLLGVLMSSPNVLILDEPTNDLDITTLAILEDYIDDFSGIVIVASHDRYFLDRVTDLTLVIDEEATFYNGNYSYYKENKKTVSEEVVKKTDNDSYHEEKKIKLSFNEQKEYDTILDEIDKIEKRLKEIEDFINLHYSDYNLCKPYYDEKEKLDNLYLEKLERYEYLDKINEESKKRKV